MTWNGEERRGASKGDINRALAIAIVVIVAVVFGGTAFVNSQRQADVLKIACDQAHGHRALTIAVRQAAEQTNRVAVELGLPIEMVMIQVPEIPPECEGVI